MAQDVQLISSHTARTTMNNESRFGCSGKGAFQNTTGRYRGNRQSRCCRNMGSGGRLACQI